MILSMAKPGEVRKLVRWEGMGPEIGKREIKTGGMGLYALTSKLTI